MKAAQGIKGFCEDHDITRSHLYRLWNMGQGPAKVYCGGRILITAEAARAWRESLPSEKAA